MSDAAEIARCRICLSENMSKLFNWNTLIEPEFMEDSTSYLDCFRECTKLEANCEDGLPQTICFSCAGQLHEAYFFIKRAKESYEMLLMEMDLIVCDKDEFDDVDQASFEWVAVQKSADNLQVNKSSAPTSPTTTQIEYTKLEVPEVKNELETESMSTETLETCTSNPTKKTEGNTNVRVGGCQGSVIKRKRGRPTNEEKKEKAMKMHSISEQDDEVSTSETGSSRRVSKSKQQKFLCHACPRIFNDASSLRQHSQTHEEHRERNYTCEKCGSKFFTKTTFQNHAKTHEKNRKAEFQCDQCEKSFFHKGSLKLHKQHHTGAMLECKMCSKKYLRHVDLEIHLRSHSGDTPFKCPYCEKAFAQVGILNKHVRQHEGYRYKCDLCSKEYVHQSTLIQHRKTHTGLPLKCSICDKAFVKRSKIKRHLGGFHKIQDAEDMEEFIVKVKTKREYRGRILEAE